MNKKRAAAREEPRRETQRKKERREKDTRAMKFTHNGPRRRTITRYRDIMFNHTLRYTCARARARKRHTRARDEMTRVAESLKLF